MFSFFGVAGKINKLDTTELLVEGDPAAIAADDTERDYLLAAVNGYLACPVRATDVL